MISNIRVCFSLVSCFLWWVPISFCIVTQMNFFLKWTPSPLMLTLVLMGLVWLLLSLCNTRDYSSVLRGLLSDILWCTCKLITCVLVLSNCDTTGHIPVASCSPTTVQPVVVSSTVLTLLSHRNKMDWLKKEVIHSGNSCDSVVHWSLSATDRQQIGDVTAAYDTVHDSVHSHYRSYKAWILIKYLRWGQQHTWQLLGFCVLVHTILSFFI